MLNRPTILGWQKVAKLMVQCDRNLPIEMSTSSESCNSWPLNFRACGHGDFAFSHVNVIVASALAAPLASLSSKSHLDNRVALSLTDVQYKKGARVVRFWVLFT